MTNTGRVVRPNELDPITKKAIHLALQSDQGARLMEIAREHVALMREIQIKRAKSFVDPAEWAADGDTRMVYFVKIELLERERDEIIRRFKGRDPGDAAVNV